MSRYPPPEYRGPPRDRSRSPSRFSERRPSTTFDSRPGPPSRAASDAPRGPRSQFDGPRPPPSGRLDSASGPRPAYTSLRDAPPLGSGDRGRPYRERDYDRRDRPPSRERSPPRGIRDGRDFPPRDLDDGRARRESRDGPLSAGSNFSDNQPPGLPPFRGGFGRGRGRGDFSYRGGRGDLIRRDRQERSPPRWTPRDRSRDSRDERRFERREDDRRPQDWPERERDREGDRLRRDQPPPRLDARPSNESMNSSNALYQPSQEPTINPDRAALIAKSDPLGRKSSVQLEPPIARDARREQPETPSYLNGRAETTAKRYGSRDSSPPTQAPAVPAFSFLPPSAPSAPSAASTQVKPPQESKPPVSPSNEAQQLDAKSVGQTRPEPPIDAPVAPKAQLASPPAAAPRAPRAIDSEEAFASTTGNRLQAPRSSESLHGQNTIPTGPANPRAEITVPPLHRPSQSPAPTSSLPTLIQPVSPRQPGRLAELGAPTGPRASRMSPRQVSISPRPPFASPRSDAGVIPGAPSRPRAQTPPPSAPSGPRGYSVSPKAAPTAPKASRGPLLAPRGPDRIPPVAPGKAPDRLSAPQPWAPPSAPRANNQWNQWRKPGASAWENKSVPAKRDFAGEEKGVIDNAALPSEYGAPSKTKTEDTAKLNTEVTVPLAGRAVDEMNIDRQHPRRQTSLVSGHSAAQSFFGKPVDEDEDEDNDENEDTGVSDMGQELPSSSEEDDSDLEGGDLTLFNAKFERKKRQLEAQMVDLSSRHYRATTPLESIARLARISAQDLQRIIEQREQEMDVDDSPVTNQNLPTTTRSSDSEESNEIATPRGDSHHRVEIRGSDDSLERFRRIRRPSPEPISLPYLVKDGRPPFHDSDAFRDGQKRQQEVTADVLDAMEQELDDSDDVVREFEVDFAAKFRTWREACEDLDRFREEQEKLERQQSLEPGPEPDAPLAPQANPFEGRRLHKYSSEYMFEQVLKQSEETARIEQERQEREQKKNQADMEKEAIVPDQLIQSELHRNKFLDWNRFRDPDSLPILFSYEPPADDFSENEQHIFIAAFRETPKKWGEIASLLPGRTYEDCIRHYYANKWDSRFRDNKHKKLKVGGRRGRGGARGHRGRMGGLMADLQDYQALENMSEKGRPRRAAAPTTFAEKEAEAKATLQGPSPNKKPGPIPKSDLNGDAGSEKPGKRQKRTGDKVGTGRKKGGQSLQNLAAVSQGVFGKEYLHNMGSKPDQARAQKLEEASLLAGLQAGHHGIVNPDGQVFYAPEGYVHPVPGVDDLDRSKTGTQGPPQKQSASSYWSVPEQTDFVKYIGHFGRDFAAIAAHMGTKTQTMIKNHFQRQIDSGSKPALEKAADEADARRQRGEDIGPPPAPTPIVKRKYENPQAPPSRPLAPHAEAMDVDEHPGIKPQAKHASPTQFQSRPQYTAPQQPSQPPTTRVIPSSMATAAHPVPAQLQPGRPSQQALGSRPQFLSDARPESRQGLQHDVGFRVTQASPLRAQQPPAGPTRADAENPQYIRNLINEQQRALQMQEQEQPQRQNSQHRYPAQGSPMSRPLHQPHERRSLGEERSSTPPARAPFPGFTRPPSLGSSSYAQMSGSSTFTTFAGRSPFSASSPKREDFRPGSVPTVPPAQAPTSASQPEPPKRSNVMSLLNNDDEEPKPPKRESLPSAAPRTESPLSQTYPHTTSSPSIPGMRREPSFGQPSALQSHFQRAPFGSQSSVPSSGQASLKHDTSSMPATQPPPQDWAAAARTIGQTSQPPSAASTLERDVRGYYQHNHRTSLLGSLGQTRAVPSPPPPPLGGIVGHSRTPSLTGVTTQPGREQTRSSLAGPPPSLHQTSQPLQPNPYGSQQPSPFSHHQPREAQNQMQHSHNSTLSGPFPSLHNRGLSRDDALRHEQMLRDRDREREREEQELRWRQQETVDAERRRDEELFRRQQEQERQQRHPPPVMHPPNFGGNAYGQPRNLDLRAQARMESEAVMQQEERQRLEERRRQEQMAREEDLIRRRQEDAYRRTPLGGGFLPPRR